MSRSCLESVERFAKARSRLNGVICVVCACCCGLGDIKRLAVVDVGSVRGVDRLCVSLWWRCVHLSVCGVALLWRRARGVLIAG